MGVFERSWNLAKLSFGVIWRDKEILAFTGLGIAVSVAFVVFASILILSGMFNELVLKMINASPYPGAIAFVFFALFCIVFSLILIFTEARCLYCK